MVDAGQELKPREVPGVHVEAIPDESFGRGTGLHRRALLMYGSEGGLHDHSEVARVYEGHEEMSTRIRGERAGASGAAS
jgi:hypothetical protein